MMRILVADDEPIEREALRLLVQRHLPDVQMVGEAGTGRQAVEMAETLRPDVILMDIEMPGLSGLEALREIRERSPGVRCLIVSAYDYFHFAREALRLEAVDYLLKPVKRDQMVEVLDRLKKEIAAERQRRQDELLRKEHLRQLRPLAEAELVALMEKGENQHRIRDLVEMLGLRLDAGLCMVVGLGDPAIDGELAPAAAESRIGDAYNRLGTLARSLCTCALGAWTGGCTTLLIELEAPVEEYAVRLWSTDLARRLRDRVKEQTGVRLRVGIGQPYEGSKELSRSFREALAAYKFEGVSEKVNHFGDLEEQGEMEPDPQPAAPASSWRPTPAVLQAVEQGKRFVERHYAEEITLERVAQEVCLTPYYYSKIFSRVVGQTLVDYLTLVRMEKARQLLADPVVTIKEACFAVGYNDPNYFSRVFKKVTGHTPTEFRAGSQG
ncbi:MAG TPA: response regulator [Symbiobacteriaceae bacterium]|nr:response regulator [Symbiobacteriaceae bacterium]